MRKAVTNSNRRKLVKKGKKLKLLQAAAAVTKANNLEDPLESFPEFQKYRKNDIIANLFIKRSHALDEHIIQWAFDLTKKNLMEKYEDSSWGWSDESKMEELSHENAWYLIARAVNGDMLGFSHFRFDLDQGIEVLYCYELQLEAVARRKGLGLFMMQILELIALTNNMKKVVLTVLKNNQNSNFFRAIGYVLDESSPRDTEKKIYSYEILSKKTTKLQS